MAKQVKWTKKFINEFLEESGLNERAEMDDDRAKFLREVMITRYWGWSQVKQASEIPGASIDKVKKAIRELKDLYDVTQKHSDVLPPRRNYTKWEKQEAKEDGRP